MSVLMDFRCEYFCENEGMKFSFIAPTWLTIFYINPSFPPAIYAPTTFPIYNIKQSWKF